MNDPLLQRFQALLEGHYAIERELGRGGMATVYLARDLRHDRMVAIKLLQPEITTSLTAERFLREIQITAKLQHPNILGLFDSGAEGGLCYYVMPHVEGESLRDRLLVEKQLSVELAIDTAIEVANALAYAHSRNVVHRDIKPENILFSAGHAIVADFGIARALSEGQRAITAVGIPLGTPPYMSPEQAQGLDNIDHRSDIYGLACVLFEMVAGRPPFVGVSLGKIIQQHLQSPPPSVREFRPEAPAALDQILGRALSKDRAGRYQTAEEMMGALRFVAATETLERSAPGSGQRMATAETATGTPTGGTTPPAGDKKRRLLIGFVTAAVAVAAAGGYFALRGGGPTETAIAVFRPEVSAADSRVAPLGPGIALEIGTALRNVAGVRLVSDASVDALQGKGLTTKQVADSLHVTFVVLTTLQSDSSQARVNVQLVDAALDNVVWTESFDYPITGLLAGQREIAQKVAAAIGPRIGRK